jgi:hypothetical protein
VLVAISASVEIPANIVFVHPVHNFAIAQYDPSQLVVVATQIESAVSPTTPSKGRVD